MISVKKNMSKETVEDTRKIDINWLMKSGSHEVGNCYYNNRITWTTSGMWGKKENSINYDLDLFDKSKSFFNLRYISRDRSSNESKDVEYKVPLTTTNCNYGGFRYWFVCPRLVCQRRVGCLYFNVTHFWCRHCCDLSYEKRNTSKRFRELSKMFDYEDKAEALALKIYGNNGRKFYKGKVTKNYKKYLEYSNYDSININCLL